MECEMEDALGDRMKIYEMAEAGRRFMPLLPILARIDGRAFSSFTRSGVGPESKPRRITRETTLQWYVGMGPS